MYSFIDFCFCLVNFTFSSPECAPRTPPTGPPPKMRLCKLYKSYSENQKIME